MSSGASTERMLRPVRRCPAAALLIEAADPRGTAVRIDDGLRAADTGGQAQLAAQYPQVEVGRGLGLYSRNAVVVATNRSASSIQG